jgi:hypothetical protein
MYRKSNAKKNGITRGWELVLSHDIKRGIASGSCKGHASSNITQCIKLLRGCMIEIRHLMLLPALILSWEVSFKFDFEQREAHDLLEKIENSIWRRETAFVDASGNASLTSPHTYWSSIIRSSRGLQSPTSKWYATWNRRRRRFMKSYQKIGGLRPSQGFIHI